MEEDIRGKLLDLTKKEWKSGSPETATKLTSTTIQILEQSQLSEEYDAVKNINDHPSTMVTGLEQPATLP